MKKEKIAFLLVAVVVVFLGGFLLFSIMSKNKTDETATGSSATEEGMVDYQSRIAEGEKLVLKDPNNYNLWVQLGNDYFDTNQPQKAVDAYDKALAIDSKSQKTPDLLTDQGIMYQRMGLYSKAISNFERAFAMNPKHAQSIFNIGVVSLKLNQKDKAIAAWEKYL
ncbi:MAG: tetratricopeptide repeat protein, partial [Desulfuromonadales bacterium]|nr:tetratricopeptide repeat protein [Desulfuromonadales bacterium]